MYFTVKNGNTINVTNKSSYSHSNFSQSVRGNYFRLNDDCILNVNSYYSGEYSYYYLNVLGDAGYHKLTPMKISGSSTELQFQVTASKTSYNIKNLLVLNNHFLMFFSTSFASVASNYLPCYMAEFLSEMSVYEVSSSISGVAKDSGKEGDIIGVYIA